MKKIIADFICNLYGEDLQYLPKKILWFLYRNLGHDFRFIGNIKFEKLSFPPIGKYEYSDFIKSGDEWFVYKTWKSRLWPVLATADIVNVQPMAGKVNLSFCVKYE